MSDPAATYHPALDRAIDRLRYQLGDVDMAAPLLVDATYTAALAQQANDESLTAIQLAEGLVAQYAQQATSVSLGGISASYANRIKGWQDLITRLRATVALAAAGAFAVLRPQRPGWTDRAEYRRECGDEVW